MVTGLLKDYYYRHNKFEHNVFNNFGGTYDTVVPGKNNICMFRIYTYEIKLLVTVSDYVAEMQERTGDYYEKQVLCSDDTIVHRNNIFEVDNGKCG